jgi:hypothetical protein
MAAAVLTTANIIDLKGLTIAASAQLIPGSDSDEETMLTMVAIASYIYNGTVWLFMIFPMCWFWFRLIRQPKTSAITNESDV